MLIKLKNFAQKYFLNACFVALFLFSSVCWTDLISNESDDSRATAQSTELKLNNSASKRIKKNASAFASFALIVTRYWPGSSGE